MSSATTNAFRRVFFQFSIFSLSFLCNENCLGVSPLSALVDSKFLALLNIPTSMGPKHGNKQPTNCNRRYIVKVTGIYQSFVAMTDGTYYKSEWKCQLQHTTDN